MSAEERVYEDFARSFINMMKLIHADSTTDEKPKQSKRLLSVQETADYLGKSKSYVEKLLRNGTLKRIKQGRSTSIDVNDIDGYIDLLRTK